PLMKLFALVARCLASPQSLPQAFHRGLRLMALDASEIHVPDTPDNVKAFGRRKTSRGTSAFPQVKVIALLEIGTHAIVDLLIRPHQRHELAAGLRLIERAVRQGMLVLWDRGLHSFKTL